MASSTADWLRQRSAGTTTIAKKTSAKGDIRLKAEAAALNGTESRGADPGNFEEDDDPEGGDLDPNDPELDGQPDTHVEDFDDFESRLTAEPLPLELVEQWEDYKRFKSGVKWVITDREVKIKDRQREIEGRLQDRQAFDRIEEDRKKEHENEVKKLKEHHENEVKKLKEHHENEVKKLKKEHEDLLRQVENEHRREVDALNEIIRQLRKDHGPVADLQAEVRRWRLLFNAQAHQTYARGQELLEILPTDLFAGPIEDEDEE